MVRQTVITIAAIGIAAAFSGASTAAQAGAKVKFYFGAPAYHGHSDYGYREAYDPYYSDEDDYAYENPCWRHKRKYRRTGRRKYLRRYRKCMRYYYD